MRMLFSGPAVALDGPGEGRGLQKLKISHVCWCTLVSSDSKDVDQTAFGLCGVQRVKYPAAAAGH